MKKLPILIVLILLSIGAVAQLARFIWDIPITVGTVYLPGWTGAPAFLLITLLVIWCFKALYSSDSKDL